MSEHIYFVNRIVTELLNKKSVFMSEVAYKKRMQKLKAQGKKGKSYA